MIGTAFAALLGAMRLSRGAVLRVLAGSAILTFRAIPPIVWLFFIFFGIFSNLLPLSPFASAAIGLGLITAANLAEIFRGAFAAIDPGQWEAARTLNLGRVSQMVDVIGPQVVRAALPSIATYAIGSLKDGAVASTIGVAKTAFQACRVSQRSFHGLDLYAVAGLAYILLSLPMAAVSRRLDQRMRAKVVLQVAWALGLPKWVEFCFKVFIAGRRWGLWIRLFRAMRNGSGFLAMSLGTIGQAAALAKTIGLFRKRGSGKSGRVFPGAIHVPPVRPQGGPVAWFQGDVG